MLSGEGLDQFLAKLDEYVSVNQHEDHLMDRHDYQSAAKEEIKGARERAKSLRRFMIIPIRTIREAKSKNLDDILFKAAVTEIIEPYRCIASDTIAHSIVNDLLSAACQWRA